MKKIYNILITLIFLSIGPLHADAPARWVVKYMDTTIHIFGTFHVLKLGIEWQTDGMLAALDESSHLILELSPAQLTGRVSYYAMKVRGLYGPDDGLDNYLDEETLIKVLASLIKSGVKRNRALQMKPWLAEMSLPRTDNTKSEYKRSLGVETILSERAQRNGQFIGGLESATLQFDVLSSLPVEKQIQSLKAALKKLSPEEDFKRNQLVQAWASGDMDTLDKSTRESLAEFPGLYKRLLPDRNKNWVRQIHVFMETPGTFFIAVGAGHMPGDEGLINLLIKAGYNVERVE